MGKEVKQWITVNGVHVPIFEGESKEDAVKNYLSKRKAEAGKKKSGNAYDEMGKKVEENRKKMDNASPEEKRKLINENHDLMTKMDQTMQDAKLKPVKKTNKKDDLGNETRESLQAEYNKLHEQLGYAQSRSRIAGLNKRMDEINKKMDEMSNKKETSSGQATHYSDINQVPKKLKPGEQYALYLKKGEVPNDGSKFAGQSYNAEYQGKGTYGVSNPKNMSPEAGFKTYEAMKKAYEERSQHPGQSYEIAIIKEPSNTSEKKPSTIFGQETNEKINAYREKFLKNKTPEQIQEIKDNLEKGGNITGYTPEDNIALAAIRREQEDRKKQNTGTGFKSREEAEEFYKNKFAGVSATYANKMAKKLGIEGRGKDKREALAKHYADQWETKSNISKNEDEKEKQIARNQQEANNAQSQKKETPDYNSADFRNARELHMAEREDARAAANGVKDRQSLRQGSEYTFTFNGKDGKKEITADFQGTKLQGGEAVSYFKDMNTGKVYALLDENIKGNVRLTNSMRNRNSLKQRIDEFVKAHPNPTDRDREKVSEMRNQYNAMMEEENKRMKDKADAIREESKQQAKKEQDLQTLKNEHYMLSKAISRGSTVAPGAEERLAKLEDQIKKLTGGDVGNTRQNLERKLAESLKKYNRPNADKEAYNMIEGYKKGQIPPEDLRMYGLTNDELKSISEAGRKEAVADIASGRNKKNAIDPLGNMVKVDRKTEYEKNYGTDLSRNRTSGTENNTSSGKRTTEQMSAAQADGMRKLKEISSSKRFNEISFERPTTGDKLRVSVEKVKTRDYWGKPTGEETYTLNIWNNSKTNEYGNHEKEYYSYGIKDMKQVKSIIKRYMSM